MKYTVKIADKTYEVEVENVYTRPIIARVDGQTFEVMPENGVQLDSEKEAGGAISIAEKSDSGLKPLPAASPTSNQALSGKTLTSPLPGTVIEVFVKKGDTVEAGQVLLIIEAMKMKNSIRSPREGKIAAVMASAGQTVTHKQALLEFEA